MAKKQKPKLKINMIDSELAKREGGKIEDSIGNIRTITAIVVTNTTNGRVRGVRYSPIEILLVIVSGAHKMTQKNSLQKKKVRKKK